MNYDIAEALRKMEEELIQSMKRNLQRHLKEEDAEGFDWAQWQAEKLNSIARYRAQNRHIIGGYISTIPQQIEDMIRQSYETGKQQEEIRILKAIRQGYLAAAGTAGEIGTGFFTVNERKLNALVKATQGEMHKAVSSILRYQDDIYRQTISGRRHSSTWAASRWGRRSMRRYRTFWHRVSGISGTRTGGM